MALYRRMNDLADRAQVDGFAAELIDRFGPLPEEVSNLVQVIEIKQFCLHARIAKMEAGTKGALVSFQNDEFAQPGALFDYVARLGTRAKLRPDSKLFVGGDWASVRARLNGALSLAKALARLASGKSVAAPAAMPEIKAKPLPPRPAVFRSKGAISR